MLTKVCTKCKQEQTIRNFYPDRRALTPTCKGVGYRPVCMSCDLAAKAARYKALKTASLNLSQ